MDNLHGNSVRISVRCIVRENQIWMDVKCHESLRKSRFPFSFLIFCSEILDKVFETRTSASLTSLFVIAILLRYVRQRNFFLSIRSLRMRHSENFTRTITQLFVLRMTNNFAINITLSHIQNNVSNNHWCINRFIVRNVNNNNI